MTYDITGGIMQKRKLVAAGAAVLALAAAGCGGSAAGGGQAASAPDPNAAEVSPPGDIPDNQAFVAYSPPGAGYSVRVPEGWARTSGGGAVTFTDKLNAVRIESAPATAPLTVAQARSAEVPKLRQGVKGFQLGNVTSVSRQAGNGVLITYLADAKPDPVTGKAGTDAIERYVFTHNGEAVTLTLSGPKGADNVDPWLIVTNSLRFPA
jgi:hypothetical protein